MNELGFAERRVDEAHLIRERVVDDDETGCGVGVAHHLAHEIGEWMIGDRCDRARPAIVQRVADLFHSRRRMNFEVV